MTSRAPSSLIQYRQAQRADISDMAAIWGIEKGEGGTSEERMMAYFDGLHHPQQALPSRILYVAHEGKSMIGYCAGHLTRRFACDAELQWIYVSAEHRCRRVGAGLLQCLAVWFKQQHAFRVCVNVARFNTVAHHFYARYGAEPMNQYWLVWSDFAAAIEKSCGRNGRSPTSDLK